MAPIPPPLLRRALILDVVLTLLMLGLSPWLMSSSGE